MLTTARAYLPSVLDEKVGINLMDVKAAIPSRGGGAIDAKDRDSREAGVVEAVWGVERVVNLSYLDLQSW
jgi:hypothetical protein